jgi:single-stranded DNA-binding protein
MSTLPLKDGVGVRIVGRLKQNTWVDGGVTHSEVQVVAEHIEVRKSK